MEKIEDHDDNAWAQANRLRRVIRLMAVFRLRQFTADLIEAMTDDEWKLVALIAEVVWPISDATKNLVIGGVREEAELPKRKINSAKARQILGAIEAKRKPKRGRK